MNRRLMFSMMMILGLMATMAITATTAEAAGRRGLLRRRAIPCCPTPVCVEHCVCASEGGCIVDEDRPLTHVMPDYYAYAYIPGSPPVYAIATHDTADGAIACLRYCYGATDIQVFAVNVEVPNCLCNPSTGFAIKKRVTLNVQVDGVSKPIEFKARMATTADLSYVVERLVERERATLASAHHISCDFVPDYSSIAIYDEL